MCLVTNLSFSCVRGMDSQSRTPTAPRLACIRTGPKKPPCGALETGGTSLEGHVGPWLGESHGRCHGGIHAGRRSLDHWASTVTHTHTNTQAPSAHLHQTEGERQSWVTPPPYHTHTLTHTKPLQRLAKMGRDVVCGESLIMSQCNLRHLENAISFLP